MISSCPSPWSARLLAIVAGAALASVLIAPAMAQPPVDQLQLKWSQPPVELIPGVVPPIYHGWDELSLYPPGTVAINNIAADDWRCRTRKPVVAVRWWGSFIGWLEQFPPPELPNAFHIGFWTNVPVGPDAIFSHPGQLVHEAIVPFNRVEFEWVGFDQMPMEPTIGDSCWRFTVLLDPFEWFDQAMFSTPTDAPIWWISISAIYDPIVPPQFPWGWKTRPHYFEDDGVVITEFTPPFPLTIGAVWVNGRELIYVPSGESYDLAFELFTTTDSCVDADWRLKYGQPPEQIAQDPPLFNGWDQPSTYTTLPMPPPLPFVADDWPCFTTWPVGAVRWWGSYLNWIDPVPPLASIPTAFHLGFWTNVPAGVDRPFSHPGVMRHDVVVPYVATDERFVGFDESPTGVGPDACFEYTVCIEDHFSWFNQNFPPPSGDVPIWWLSVSAIFDPPVTAPYEWGWKTRPHVSEDDAVVTTGFAPVPMVPGTIWFDGFPIESAPGVSWDVSFELYAPPACEMADADNDGDVDTADFAVFAQCFGGSNNPPSPNCPPGVYPDYDGDGDVDTADFAVFAQCFTGSH